MEMKSHACPVLTLADSHSITIWPTTLVLGETWNSRREVVASASPQALQRHTRAPLRAPVRKFFCPAEMNYFIHSDRPGDGRNLTARLSNSVHSAPNQRCSSARRSQRQPFRWGSGHVCASLHSIRSRSGCRCRQDNIVHEQPTRQTSPCPVVVLSL